MRMETCIKKGLGLKAHRVREVREDGGRLVAEIEWISSRRLVCGNCSRQTKAIHSVRPVREWRDLRVRDQELVLVYGPRRVRCPACGPRVEHVPWARRWQRVTIGLWREIAKLTRLMSWKEAAEHLSLNWKTVAAAVEGAVTWGLERRQWKPPRIIGIDEVSRRKGQRYLTLVYDLGRHSLLWIGENRDSETMRQFFGWLGKRGRSIQVVCCDMWAIYVDAMRTRLPHASLLFDRFHVVAHLNRAVDEVRREMWRKLGKEDRAAFLKSRWLWLKNPWNLSRPERRRLSALCRRNSPLVRGYYLKEAFQRFWDYLHPTWAKNYLKHWLWWASHSRLKPFTEFAKMIRRHLDGILGWTELRVANGALEGMNNRVKIVSHRAYGFRSVNTYTTAIWHGCGQLPLP